MSKVLSYKSTFSMIPFSFDSLKNVFMQEKSQSRSLCEIGFSLYVTLDPAGVVSIPASLLPSYHWHKEIPLRAVVSNSPITAASSPEYFQIRLLPLDSLTILWAACC